MADNVTIEEPEEVPEFELPPAEAGAVAALLEDWQEMDSTMIAERIDGDQTLGALPLEKRARIMEAVKAFQDKRAAADGEKPEIPAGPEQQEHPPRLCYGSNVRFKTDRHWPAGSKGIVVKRESSGGAICFSVRINNPFNEVKDEIRPADVEVLTDGFDISDTVSFRPGIKKYAYGAQGGRGRPPAIKGTVLSIQGWDEEKDCVRLGVSFPGGYWEAGHHELILEKAGY